MEFLVGEALTDKIRRVCEGENLCVASAFWGRGAADFLGNRAVESGRFLADLTMGGTNPDELRSLGAPTSYRIKAVPSLHAKVYLSSKGAVVGSANISQNGIGWLDHPNLIEAGVFIPAGQKQWMAVLEWFEGLYGSALPIDEASLEDAERRWKLRASARAGRVSAVRPSDVSEWGWVLWVNQVPAKRKRQAVEELSNYLGEDIQLNKYEIYDDWTDEDVSKWPDYFVAIDPRYGVVLRRKVHSLGRTVYAEKLKMRHYFPKNWGTDLQKKFQLNTRALEELRGEVLSPQEAANVMRTLK
ncbi:phospholipase D family protein [Paracoccus sanguinis]|uniref:phospholipase D family protein n=1 Tax=Paracoccus sanguinis TaxID=1545044 RepID=UPI0020A00AA7|nr:hypothetical protein [Paracoccus sanguinis]